VIEVAGLARPKPGQRVCGDAWLRLDRDGGVVLAILDGLGHGPEAATAAATGVAALHELTEVAAPDDLGRILLSLHGRLRGTRGVVAGVAWLKPDSGALHYVGIGNTEVRVLGSEPTRLYSRAGLLGGERRPTPVVQIATLPAGAVLVLHTDGIRPLEAARVTLSGSCEAIAQQLLAEHGRDDDDAGLLVARVRPAA
jgi:serine phosphatase RsbU (regulator of sigma subunit)